MSIYLYYLGLGAQHNFYLEADLYHKYYIIAISISFLLTLSLCFKRKVRDNLMLLVVSTLLSFYLVELTLYISEFGDTNSDIRHNIAKIQNKKFDDRDKRSIIRDMKADGVDNVKPSFHPIQVISDSNFDDNSLLPLGGVSNATTVYCNETGEYMIYISDRYGFNNPDTEWRNDSIDWTLIGDSFTHGACVKKGENIADNIRTLTGDSVLNLGIGGNGPLLEFASFLEYAVNKKPKKVVWFYYENNDLRGDLSMEMSSKILRKYIDYGITQNLIYKQKNINSIINEMINNATDKSNRFQKYNLNKFIKLHLLRNFLFSDGQKKVEINKMFLRIIKKANDLTRSWGGDFYFVYLPEYYRYLTTGVSHDNYRKRKDVISAVKGMGIKVVDIHNSVFVDHKDPLSLFPYRVKGHYNDKGYKAVSESIIRHTR
jgi:hypothetical protein